LTAVEKLNKKENTGEARDDSDKKEFEDENDEIMSLRL